MDFCNDRFVAVVGDGQWSRVYTSVDGLEWTSSSIQVEPFVSAVTYGEGLYVAVLDTYGSGARVLTSPDLQTWTVRRSYQEVPGASSQSSANLTLDEVVFRSGKFIAVGVWGAILTSTDGLEWLYNPPRASENNLNGVTFGDGGFVAIGGLGTALVSPDGTSWRGTNVGYAVTLIGVAFGNGTYVAAGEHELIASPNGLDWSHPPPLPVPVLNAITYGNGLFVAFGGEYEAQYALTSTDGLSWSARILLPSADPIRYAYFDGTRFVALASLHPLVSTDGANWSTITPDQLN